MASGDPMGVLYFVRPSVDPATRKWRVGVDGRRLPTHGFIDSAIRNIDAFGVLDANYGGGGLTLSGSLMAASATTGDVFMEAGIRRDSTADDTDADHSYSWKSATVSVSGTNGARTGFTISFSNGSEMDSLAAGEPYSIRIRRKAGASGDAADTLIGDAETFLTGWTVRET